MCSFSYSLVREWDGAGFPHISLAMRIILTLGSALIFNKKRFSRKKNKCMLYSIPSVWFCLCVSVLHSSNQLMDATPSFVLVNKKSKPNSLSPVTQMTLLKCISFLNKDVFLWIEGVWINKQKNLMSKCRLPFRFFNFFFINALSFFRRRSLDGGGRIYPKIHLMAASAKLINF